MTPASLTTLETYLTGDTPAIVQMSGDDARALLRYVRAREEEAAELRLVVEAYELQLAELRAVLAGRKAP